MAGLIHFPIIVCRSFQNKQFPKPFHTRKHSLGKMILLRASKGNLTMEE
jgi:hypothetical protein